MSGSESASLRRRMNEVEQALTFTIFVLMFLLVLTSAGLFDQSQIDEGSTSKMAKREPPKPSSSAVDESLSSTLRGSLQSLTTTLIPQREVDLDPDVYFLPGSIPNMTRTDVLHHCFVPVTLRIPPGQGCSVSEQYKIIFHLTPKSGSSTGRHVIKKDFEGQDHASESKCKKPSTDGENWIEVAVLRNPATRAFASYEEMFVRRLESPESIPANSRAFIKPFRGWVYKNYSALFDTIEGVKKLNDAYEKFMEDWDGYAFDMHLESQVAYNVRRSAVLKSRHDTSHLTFVFDTHSMEESFHKLAEMVDLKKKPQVIKGRAYPRRLNVTNVSDKAFRRMCQRYKEDFCCLNYALPPACLSAEDPGTRVRCKWVDDPEKIYDRLIEAVVV